ncbi:hypothetical protein NQ317_009632 [Molorchus minor]|uniref:Uncharacterized protein n=1 Tax=Molorchus minor TaxID=1323400 RepID=A0ABQ9IUU5_9CUCU|nr:hypothetical protein NQ317_009632 [Molorchus minor]
MDGSEIVQQILFSVLSVYFVYNFIDTKMEAFRIHEIVPDVVSSLPERVLEVKFKSGRDVNLGNEIGPKFVIEPPEVHYDADPNGFYTLILTDPDAPSRKNPIRREWNHWLVVNIPGSRISEGEVLSEYIGSAPGQGTELHRYTFLLYQQPKKLVFDEPRHNDTDPKRGNFSAEKFANKYNMGNPIAGNFFPGPI